MPLKKLLVTTDLSDDSQAALLMARDLAPQLGAEVEVLHVLDFTLARPPGVAFLPPSQDLAMRTALREKIVDAMNTLQRAVFADTPAISVRSTLVEGVGVAHTLCEFAKHNGIDLIVIASHGRTGITHLMLGSVAERVARSAHCPVLIVPSHPRT